MINENNTFADASALEESATLYNTSSLTMITTVASTTTDTAVSAAIDADPVILISRTANDNTTSIKMNTRSFTITNAITTKFYTSAKYAKQLS